MSGGRATIPVLAVALAACSGRSQAPAPAAAGSASAAAVATSSAGSSSAPSSQPGVDALVAQLTTGCPDHAPRERWCAVAGFDRGTHDASLDGRAVLFGFTVWLSTDLTLDDAFEHEALSALIVEPRDGGHVAQLAPLQGLDEELEPGATAVRDVFEHITQEATIPHALWTKVDGWRGELTQSLVASPHGWTLPHFIGQEDLELRRVGPVLVAMLRSHSSPSVMLGVFTDHVAEARAP